MDLFPYTKTPHFRILIILFLPRHSPITLNFSRYHTEMHQLPIPDIADLDKLNSGNIITFPLLSRSLLSPTVSERKLAVPSGSEQFCSETLRSARNGRSVKSGLIFEISRNFSEHIPINSEQILGITQIRSEPIPSKSDHI